MSPNRNIIFSKEKRFTTFEDPKNSKVTYLKDHCNMALINKYKAIGFGYGSKTDFTRERRETPGVGGYKLPTIWDRY